MNETSATPTVIDRPASGEPTVAVAFGGGGARGFAHIHVMEVLDDLGIRPVAISGASIGSIIGSGMAAGMTGKAVREFVIEMVSNRADLLSRFWAARPSGLSDMMDGGFRLGQFNIERVLKAFLPSDLPATFEELQIPMSIVGTDFYGHREVFFEQGELVSAIGASAALPVVFRPVKRNGVFYIDGGIFNPVPYDHLLGKADVVIGIDVVGGPEGDTSVAPNSVDSLYAASQLMMQSLMQAKLQIEAPDIFIRPPVSRFRVMDFLKAKQILASTETVRDELKYKIDGVFQALEIERRAGA